MFYSLSTESVSSLLLWLFPLVAIIYIWGRYVKVGLIAEKPESFQRTLRWLRQDSFGIFYTSALNWLLNNLGSLIGDRRKFSIAYTTQSKNIFLHAIFKVNPFTVESYEKIFLLALIYPYFIVISALSSVGSIGLSGFSLFEEWGFGNSYALLVWILFCFSVIFVLTRLKNNYKSWLLIFGFFIFVRLLDLSSVYTLEAWLIIDALVVGLLLSYSLLINVYLPSGERKKDNLFRLFFSSLFCYVFCLLVGDIHFSLVAFFFLIPLYFAFTESLIMASYAMIINTLIFIFLSLLTIIFYFLLNALFAISFGMDLYGWTNDADNNFPGYVMDFIYILIFFVIILTWFLSFYLTRKFFFGFKKKKKTGLYWLIINLTFFSIFYLFSVNYGLLAEARWVLFFLLIMPLINALFDWLSLGITRGFLLKIKDGDRNFLTCLLWGAFDLLWGVFVLFVMVGFFIVFINSASFLSVFGSNADIGTPLYNLTAIDLSRDISEIKKKPQSLQYWWIYFMLLSTLVPTPIHFALAGGAATLWLPTKARHWLADGLEKDEHKTLLAWAYLTFTPIIGFILVPAGLLYFLYWLITVNGGWLGGHLLNWAQLLAEFASPTM